ncbi:hypothetical protein [uncultured Algibacter sp.]|uniref:DUF7738 domain-containing protein n=1 Tax=uncultured Algibacter sp. TaxID=298659 RepID=UPI002613A2C8|nr:hypothetical protein [uncultured Algibacter sp.]
MKKIITILILCISTSICFGQIEVTIEYNSDNSVLLNGIPINNTTMYSEIVKILGEPVIYKEYPTGKTNYHYEELGLILHTVNGNLLTIGVNFNWDGDKNFPETIFKGTLKIGTTSINQESKSTVVDEMKGFEIKCIMPEMCMNNPKTVKNPILLGFKNDLISQISIEFH